MHFPAVPMHFSVLRKIQRRSSWVFLGVNWTKERKGQILTEPFLCIYFMCGLFEPFIIRHFCRVPRAGPLWLKEKKRDTVLVTACLGIILFFLEQEHTARPRAPAPAKDIRKTRNKRGMAVLWRSAVAKDRSPRSQRVTAWRGAMILE